MLEAHTQTKPATASAMASPLSAQHLAQLDQAQLRRKKLNRAVMVASFNAWSFAILAVFSLLLGFFSLTSLLIGLALAGLAFNEFRGRRQLRQLLMHSTRTLGINQLICCILIAIYCSLSIYQTLTGPGVYAQAIEQSPDLADMLKPMEDLLQKAAIATYVLVFVLGVGLQGLTAWYYFSRRRHLRDYVQQTPEWILELNRAQSSA